MIDPNHWSNGYATESLTAFLARYYAVFGKEEGGKILACTDSLNKGSQRVLGKVGFGEVGRGVYDNVTLGRREEVFFEFEVGG